MEHFDSTGDGYLDSILVDGNGDGYAETILRDTTGDGFVDHAAQDTVGDGSADSYVWDTTGDGAFDTAASDHDLDGGLDAAGWDTNGDGVLDHYAGPETGGQTVAVTEPPAMNPGGTVVVGGSAREMFDAEAMAEQQLAPLIAAIEEPSQPLSDLDLNTQVANTNHLTQGPWAITSLARLTDTMSPDVAGT